MKEIALYGLGGQGVVTAAQILTLAAGVHDDMYAQCIPLFTHERRGAPVYAYVRISNKPILIHSYVYEPDCVVSFALHATPWSQLTAGGRKQLIGVANIPHEQPDAFAKLGMTGGYLDADRLTQQFLGPGAPPNIAILGGFAAVVGWIRFQAILEAIMSFWPGEKGKTNTLLAIRALEQTVQS